jgi:phenylpyruvate tautomerase PptA (4-oxalocrotonate tautomerase family)
MPILEVHLVEGEHTAAQHAELLTRMSARYAEVLASPLERIRAYVSVHRRELWATGGAVGVEAPYFTAIVLKVACRQRATAEAFTDILVTPPGVDQPVRGRIIQVSPEDWAIGGVPASAARSVEIAARSGTSDRGRIDLGQKMPRRADVQRQRRAVERARLGCRSVATAQATSAGIQAWAEGRLGGPLGELVDRYAAGVGRLPRQLAPRGVGRSGRDQVRGHPARAVGDRD